MMNNSIKNLAAWMSRRENWNYVISAKDETEKTRRINELRQKFDASNFSSVNFNDSGYVEDSNGVPNLDENFAAERALFDIRRHLIRAELEKTLVPQINAKNATTKRNAQRKLEFQKQLQKNY